MSAFWMAAIVFALIFIWWWRSRNLIHSENGINTLRSGDRDMERAIAKAREDFPHFVERLRQPQPGDENFAIKVGIKHAGNTEHIWLCDVSVEDNCITGTLGNDPQHVPYKIGASWRGDLSDLSDWTYFSNGRMQGNFTLRAMLPRMPRQQREQARLMLDSTWDTRELVHLPWPRDAAMPGAPLPSDLSHGDPALMDAVSDHLTAHFGEIPRVFHELISPSAHIDLYPYPATAQRPFHIIVTTGMAEQPMQVPADSDADSRTELVLLLPAAWPLDQKSWHSEKHYWPMRWIKRVARFHYETGRWLGAGHLLTHGEPPSAIDPSCAYDSVLLADAAQLPDSFHRLTLKDGRKLRFLCLYFIDPATREAWAEQGWDQFPRAQLAQRLSV